MNRLPLATPRYSVIQAFYWASYCMTFGFASVYLLSEGYNNSEIGMLLAAINILAVFLQPLMAAFVDKSSRISLKDFIAIILGSVFVFSLLIWMTSGSKYLTMVLIALAFGILISTQPLINAICFRYEQMGIKINYGVARGIGSGAYALTSFGLGNLIEKFDASFLPIYYMGTVTILIGLIYTYAPKNEKGEVVTARTAGLLDGELDKVEVEALSMKAFIKKYRAFSAFILGCAFVFFPHSLINNFMIQVMHEIGGGSAQMGTAIFIAAGLEIPVMFLFTRIQKSVDCSCLLKLTAVVFTIKHLLTYMAGSVAMFYMAQILQIVGFGLFMPAAVYFVDQVIDFDDLVKGQAMITGAMTLGSTAASMVGGILLDVVGVKEMLLLGGAVSVIGTLMMILALGKIEVPLKKPDIV